MQNPIVIIGAPRSGTNMLRDILCKHEAVATWPCDEINYVWKHGNRAHPHDQFQRSLATPKIKAYIQKQFVKQLARTGSQRIVEKTCANSLRVEFVDEVFPAAQFVFIIRDGQDAAVSAVVKSRAPLNLAYLWSKVRFVPVSDIPYYGFRYLTARLQRLTTKTRVMKNWGPVPKTALSANEHATPLQLSAYQWSECVTVAASQLKALGPHRYITVRYEDFVAQPEVEFTRIAQFLNLTVPEELTSILSDIDKNRVGKGRKSIESSEHDSIKVTVDTASLKLSQLV